LTDTAPGAVTAEPVRPGDYGAKVGAVEPGGVEYIADTERHGRPVHLLWTWISPNMEFATVFVGILAVSVFGLSFWQAVLALLVGNILGSVSQGVLSARGPAHGVPQMVLSRAGFGYWGNVLPAGLNAITAGIGWFAVNSVSGAFALAALTGMPPLLGLVIIVLVQIVVAFFGHNLVQVFERYALIFLAVVFAIATVVILTKAHPGAAAHPIPGGFLLTAGAAFGYAAGWNPYASDYTRYLPKNVNTKLVGLWAGLGVFISCMVIEIAGAASVTAGGTSEANPTGAFTGQLPTVLADLTLLAIALGAVAANVLNVYSAAMSFLTLGIKLPLGLRRALVAVVFGLIGFFLAWSALADAGAKYTNFLEIIAYWIGPWLGVFFTDQYLRRRDRAGAVDEVLYAVWYRNWAGPIAMLVAIVVSILLFSNQIDFTGYVVRHAEGLGDITFLVGFVLAALLYAGLRPFLGARRTTAPTA
jgi:NCS1 family nucleobase:cation symporter-1